jgi:hypothetical protein
MYPKKDILKILGDSGYHSEEWEMTDDEYEYEGTIFTNYIYYTLFIIKKLIY